MANAAGWNELGSANPVHAGVRVEGRADEAAFVSELRAGSEEAYAWLIRQYHQPVYSLIARSLNDAADAADTTQEVFIKVFRGMQGFQGDSSLKTWIYRIALHEASNHRRWWSRHKAKDVSIDGPAYECDGENEPQTSGPGLKDQLAAGGESPFQSAANAQLREQVEAALQEVSQPYRTTLILRDLEELSYEEIATITAVTLGTVKSRLTRGREMLRGRLAIYLNRSGVERSPARSARTLRGNESRNEGQNESVKENETRNENSNHSVTDSGSTCTPSSEPYGSRPFEVTV